MVTKARKSEEAGVSELETLAVKLDGLAQEATALGEDAVVKSITTAAKSCRWADKQRQNRLKRVGTIVQTLKEKGLSADEIVARLTGGKA
jgi:hypothetical protein